jgi:acetyl-CoA C-acetyltransferase
VTTSGTTINRFCSSGLQAVASIAHSIVHDQVVCGVGGGVDSISLVQPKLVKGAVPERHLLKSYPALWMPMIQTVSAAPTPSLWWHAIPHCIALLTAEHFQLHLCLCSVLQADIVAARYGISRERQDAYSVESQRRTGVAQASGLFDEEIVPMQTKMQVKDKASGEVTLQDYTVVKDECNRPGTTMEDVQGLAPIRLEEDPAATITAGNASQLSDGASACVLMDEGEALRLGLEPLGAFMGCVFQWYCTRSYPRSAAA